VTSCRDPGCIINDDDCCCFLFFLYTTASCIIVVLIDLNIEVKNNCSMVQGGDVAAVVKQTLTIEDEDIFDYIVSVISDESFEFGEDAQDANEALGPLLVR